MDKDTEAMSLGDSTLKIERRWRARVVLPEQEGPESVRRMVRGGEEGGILSWGEVR